MDKALVLGEAVEGAFYALHRRHCELRPQPPGVIVEPSR